MVSKESRQLVRAKKHMKIRKESVNKWLVRNQEAKFA